MTPQWADSLARSPVWSVVDSAASASAHIVRDMKLFANSIQRRRRRRQRRGDKSDAVSAEFRALPAPSSFVILGRCNTTDCGKCAMRCVALHWANFFTEMVIPPPSFRRSTALFLKRPMGRIFRKPGIDIGRTFIVTPAPAHVPVGRGRPVGRSVSFLSVLPPCLFPSRKIRCRYRGCSQHSTQLGDRSRGLRQRTDTSSGGNG